MPDYRRWYVEGGTYFFTVVTAQRRTLFSQPAARDLLGNVMREVAQKMPFQTLAIALLPDHLHALWQLPHNDADFSTRWKKIKAGFTSKWIRNGGTEAEVSHARKNRGARGVWQRRFWEHVIRDEADLEAHFDYIHFNPVKHGLAAHPSEWEWSTFQKYVRSGHYPPEWGRSEPKNVQSLNIE